MQTHQPDALSNIGDTPVKKPVDLGRIQKFASSGIHLRTDEFDLNELISLQTGLHEEEAYLFVKGDELEEVQSISVDNLLQRTPLLLTSRGFFLVAPQTPGDPIELRVQGHTVKIVGVDQAQKLLTHHEHS